MSTADGGASTGPLVRLPVKGKSVTEGTTMLQASGGTQQVLRSPVALYMTCILQWPHTFAPLLVYLLYQMNDEALRMVASTTTAVEQLQCSEAAQVPLSYPWSCICSFGSSPFPFSPTRALHSELFLLL